MINMIILILRDGCPNMEHINISWCDKVSMKGVEALARGCPKLKAFICKGCSLVCIIYTIKIHSHNIIRPE